MKISDCCGAAVDGNEDYGICPDCKEHCEFIDDEDDLEDEIIEKITKDMKEEIFTKNQNNNCNGIF